MSYQLPSNQRLPPLTYRTSSARLSTRILKKRASAPFRSISAVLYGGVACLDRRPVGGVVLGRNGQKARGEDNDQGCERV